MVDTPALQNVRVLVAHRDDAFCRGVSALLGSVGAEVIAASERVAWRAGLRLTDENRAGERVWRAGA